MNTTTPIEATETTPAKPVREFERKICGRCAGSGRFSYCSSYGSTCFDCNGKRKVLTTRGKAAWAWYRARHTVKAGAVQVGDWIESCGTRMRVISTGYSEATRYQDKDSGEWKSYYELQGQNKKGPTGLYTFADADVLLLPKTNTERAAWLAEAFDYQDTLTKAGTVRKGKAKAKAKAEDEAQPEAA